MKYKVGDKVRIKSKEWYESNKDNAGDVALSDGYHFWKGMARILGDVVEIEQVNPKEKCYMVVENNYHISEEMIEGIAAEDQLKPTLFDFIKSSILEAAKQAPVIVEQTEDGGIKISPINTPSFKAAMTCKELGGEWTLGLYIPGKEQDWSKVGIKYVIPFESFNPYNIEESLKHNIVK